MLEHDRNVVRCDVSIRKAERDQSPMLRAWLQLTRGLQNRNARTLRADQRARYMEAVLGQKLVEIVAGDTPRNIREAFPYQGGIAIAQPLQAGVDLPSAATLRQDRGKLRLAGLADRHAGSVVQQNVQRFDIVDRLAAHQRVHTAGVVADHPTERTAAVRRRIGRKGQLMLFCRIAKRIEDDARLDPRQACLRVERDDSPHVLRKIEHHRYVAALARDAGAAAARKHRRTELTARGDRCDHVVRVSRQHQANRYLPVVRGVRCIQCAGS